MRRAINVSAFLILTTAMLFGALPAIGAGEHTNNARVAFVARNDNPFDSMTVGPIASQVGGVLAITAPGALSDAAEGILVDFAPDLVIVVGGAAAVSEATFGQVDAAGAWDTRRVFGTTRDSTAAAVAALLDEYRIARPHQLASPDGAVVPSSGSPTENGEALLAELAQGGGTSDAQRVIHLGAGRYDLGSTQLDVPDRTMIVGLGDATTITCDCTGATPEEGAAVVLGERATLRSVSVLNRIDDQPGAAHRTGVYAAQPTGCLELRGLRVFVTGEEPDLTGIDLNSACFLGSGVRYDDIEVTIQADGADTTAVGLRLRNRAAVRNLRVEIFTFLGDPDSIIGVHSTTSGVQLFNPVIIVSGAVGTPVVITLQTELDSAADVDLAVHGGHLESSGDLAYSKGTSSIGIADALISSNSIIGNVTCFGTFRADFTAFAC